MPGAKGRSTEAGPADGTGPGGRSPSSSPPPAPRIRKARRSGNGVRTIVSCAGLLLIFAVGVFAVGDSAAPLRLPEDRSNEFNFSTIKLGREGDLCRRATIDNKSGALTDNGRAACEDPLPTDPKEIARQRYSGGRLQSISDTFKSR